MPKPFVSAIVMRKQRGLAAIEATVVLPFLLLVFLATAEIGRMAMQYNTLNKQHRTAARYLSQNAEGGIVTTAVITATRNLVLYGNKAGTGALLVPGMTAAMVSVTAVNSTTVQVTSAFQYQPFYGDIPGFYGSPIDMSRWLRPSVTMRVM